MNHNMQKLLATLPDPVVKHIQHLERMRQDFVANVSHELRTPLTVIHGYLETLLDQHNYDTTSLQKIFLQMQQQTLRMENLIEDLLLLAHLEEHENEEIDNNSKKIVVTDLLKTISNEAKELSGELNHHIQLKIENNLSLIGYEDELRSLFSNIVFNAVKYTPARGNITIEWYHDEKNRGIFKVIDTGIGMAKEHIPRITERFYRVDKARSRDSGGTGLGLAIAKHVLLRHHGELTIESEPGAGSTFTCIFPSEISVVIKSS